MSDIDEAIVAGRDTVAATPMDDPARSLHLYNLGLALRSRFEHTGRQADLTEAIAVGHEAVAATPPDHPYRTGRLLGIGRALHARFQHSGQPADLTDAIRAFMAAVRVESGSTMLCHSSRPEQKCVNEWIIWPTVRPLAICCQRIPYVLPLPFRGPRRFCVSG